MLPEGRYDQFDLCANLAVPLKDIVRYWWNNIADQYAIIDMVMDDIWTEYKNRSLPHQRNAEAADTPDVIEGILEAQGKTVNVTDSSDQNSPKSKYYPTRI